jgi:glutathione S-transferase
MNILYYSPGACSLAVHVVLEEIGAPFEKRLVSIPRGEHEGPEYTKINPLQRVPALETEHGIFTEAAVILQYLARSHPEAKLLPADPLLVRAQEWLSFLGTSVHPAFAPIFRPKRWANDEAAQEQVATRCRARVQELLGHASRRFGEGPWALGSSFSVVDPYLLVFLLWAKRYSIGREGWESLEPFIERALARPSVSRAIAAEKADSRS